MSTNPKKVKLNPSIDEINRQSFDDRICDDLCEVILQFLPFNDKFRLQCVSKQFQRTVFEKVRYLDISSFGLNLSAIESVLKKCPTIELIDLRDYKNFHQTNAAKVEYNLIIDWIIRYCNHLNKFCGYFDLMIDSNKQKFIQKFGSKLKEINFSDTSDGNVLRLFPNIEKLDLEDYWPLLDNLNIEFKQLKKLKIQLSTDVEPYFMLNEQFTTFIKANPFIEDMCIYYEDAYDDDNPNDINLILLQISRLKNLVKLRINFGFNLNLFEESLKQIAVNCPKLKTILYDIFTVNSEHNRDMNHLLSTLKVFKQIKCLQIYLILVDGTDVDDDFSCKLFKGFENLTHLSIAFDDPTININDTILEDIDINLPKLKYLNINCDQFNATKWTHIILRRLSALHTIILNITDDNMRDIIKTKLIEHKKLKTIKLTNK